MSKKNNGLVENIENPTIVSDSNSDNLEFAKLSKKVLLTKRLCEFLRNCTVENRIKFLSITTKKGKFYVSYEISDTPVGLSFEVKNELFRLFDFLVKTDWNLVHSVTVRKVNNSDRYYISYKMLVE